MEKMKRLIGWLCLLFVCMFSFMLSACSSSGDDSTVADEGQLVEVPDFDENTWVTDSDIKSEDLDQLVDLSVKVERIRQELFLMLSNGGEGDKPFCGVGPKTDVSPTIKLVTDMLEKEDKYREVLDRLDGTAILSPTATRGKLKNLWDIITTGRTEAEAEKEKVQEILTANKVYGNTKAQQQLYDFYCSQEPDYAKKINAKDAKDFFNKLNNGELNNYMLNISHIWRDKGILEADKATSAVGDYAYTAFTGKPEYLNSAYRVSSKVAVAAGELYLTAIDDYAGGYGAKIMEFGDAIQNKITKLKLMKKFLEGKPDWQGVNKYVVDNLKSDIQDAISDALGDDSIGKDIVEMVTEEILDWVAEQCTSDDEGGESSEEAEKKKDELAKQDDIAILNIETDFSSQGKMILVTDEATGKVHVATPTYDGHVSIVTTPGSKLVTVIKKNGERLTKRFTATAGSNTLIIKSEQAPYIDLNPSSISHEDDAGSEAAIVLTNMKYIKLRKPNKEEWWDVQLEINGSAGRGTHVRVIYKANLEEKERKGSFILEGYKEKDDAKPSVTKTFQFTQDPYTTELTPIGVSPTSLLFDAKGGEQIVKVDIKNYKYCGVTSDEKYDSWLTATANNDATITVKVAPNETGEERTAVIYAFGTDAENVQTLDQVAFKAIPITQKAGEGGPGFNSDILSAEFFLDLFNSATVHNDVNGEITTGTADVFSYRIWGDTKSEILKQLSESSSYTDVNMKQYDVVTEHEGQDLVVKIDIDYNYIYNGAHKEKHSDKKNILIKLRGDGTGNIEKYKVIYCSFDTKSRVDNLDSKTYDYTEEIDNYIIEADIPYKSVYNGVYYFELKGKDIQRDYFTRFYHLKDREWQGWSLRDGPMDKYSEKYTDGLVSISPDERNLIEVRLRFKE